MPFDRRLSWMGLKSWQAGHRTWRRDQRDKRVRPTLTLLEERILLSQPGTWAAVAPLPTERENLGATTGKDGTIYAIGGYGPAGASSEVDVYNPTTNTWRTVAPLPAARYGLAAQTSANGTIYAIGGLDWNNQPSSNVYAYNPATNIWTQVASMPTEHAFFAAAVGQDGTIYAIGGENGSTYMMGSEADAYNPNTNTWVQVASLPPIAYAGTDWVGRYELTAAAGKDGTIYVIGGLAEGVGVTNSVEAYHPTTNTWTQVADLPTDRMDLAATTGADGIIYAMGGDNYSPAVNNVYAYNPGTDTWTEIAGLPSARNYLAATTGIDGTIYAIGGDVDVTGVPGDPPGEIRGVPSAEVDAYLPIALLSQTINFVALANQTYGVTPITLSATDTSGLPVSFSVISGPATITGSVLTVTGMGNVVVEASQAGNGTYAVATPVDKSFTVSPALLTITANNDSKTYGTLKTFSSTAFTETGLVNSDTITGVTETSTGAATSATVGTYNIVASAATGTGLSNYTISYVDGTLTVNPASLLSLTVTTLDDDPSGSIPGFTTLRDAITQADTDDANQYAINFAVNGTINLTNDLPNLNNKGIPR